MTHMINGYRRSDYDEPFLYGLNWIRSGSYSDEDDDKLDDYFSDEDLNGI